MKNVLKWPYSDLVNGELSKTYQFDENSHLSFKLTDNDVLIKSIQRAVKTHNELSDKLDSQYDFVKTLKETKLWLDVETSIISMSLFDIYNGLMKHLKDHSFEDQLFNCHQVSFVGPMGPFKQMPLIKCLNEDLIDKMLFHSVLKNKLPSRKLRVKTQGKILLKYGKGLKETGIINISQITDSGILLSSTNDQLLQDLSQSEHIKLLIDTDGLNEFVENGLKSPQKEARELYYTTDENKFVMIEEKEMIKSLSYSSGDSNEFYLFCRYQHMLHSDASKDFQNFTSSVKKYFEDLVA